MSRQKDDLFSWGRFESVARILVKAIQVKWIGEFIGCDVNVDRFDNISLNTDSIVGTSEQCAGFRTGAVEENSEN